MVCLFCVACVCFYGCIIRNAWFVCFGSCFCFSCVGLLDCLFLCVSHAMNLLLGKTVYLVARILRPKNGHIFCFKKVIPDSCAKTVFGSESKNMSAALAKQHIRRFAEISNAMVQNQFLGHKR